MKRIFFFLVLCLFPLTTGVADQRVKQVSSDYDTAQFTLSTSASLVSAPSQLKQSVLIDNHDAVINIYVGKSTVTSSNGKLVRAGQAITIHTTAAIYAVAGSGTPTISILVEKETP